MDGDDAPCTIVLGTARVESANALALDDTGGCTKRLLGAPAAGWRVATDGIDLVGADRLSVGFFSFTGDGSATLARPGKPALRLVRA